MDHDKSYTNNDKLNIYLDFEYLPRKVPIGNHKIICCSVIIEDQWLHQEKQSFIFPKELESFIDNMKTLTYNYDVVFHSYNLYGAEGTIFYHLFGRNFCLTNNFIDLILKGFPYSDIEMKLIVSYCEEDTQHLPQLHLQMANVIRDKNKESDAIRRGNAVMNYVVSYEEGKGFPIDVDKLTKVFENRDRIKIAIQRKCNEDSGFQIYEPLFTGPKNNKVFQKYTFNLNNFGAYLNRHNLYQIWQRTASGRLTTSEDYLDEMCSKYKEILAPFYHTRNSLKQLSSTDLSTLLTPNGYIKGENIPYAQVSSRTSPKPSKGFMLNLSPWLRMLVKPKPGKVFVSFDFKSQEVLIAAALSKDKNLLEDYKTDVYM